MDLALPPGTCRWRGKLAGGQQRLPGEWVDTMLVGAARGTLGDTRQETVVRRDASPSLCCLVPGIHEHPRVSWPEEAPPALWEPSAARASQPPSCSVEASIQVGLGGPRAASSPAAWAALLSFPTTFPLPHPGLSDARDTAAVPQSPPPRWVTPRSGSTSHCTSPRCHPGTALTPSCCRRFPRHLRANNVRACGADAMPPSLHPQYAVQRLARPRLSPAPARADHTLSILP